MFVLCLPCAYADVSYLTISTIMGRIFRGEDYPTATKFEWLTNSFRLALLIVKLIA